MKKKKAKRIITISITILIIISLFIFRCNIISLFNKYKSGLEILKANGNLISDSELSSLEDSGITGSKYSFDTNYYPYYAMLNKDEKEVYKQVYANIIEVKTKIVPIKKISTNSLTTIIESVYNDHPELFFVDNSYTYKYTKDDRCAQIILKYNSTVNNLDSSINTFNDKVNYIISKANSYSSNYEKEKYVHDYLINNVSYNENSSLNQTAYSALVNGQTVCAGYARAFQYIMTKLGIPTYYCVGYSQNQNHAWNIIRLDDGYYNVDVTWDDSRYSKYSFFNRTDKDFASTHSRSTLSNNLPKCEGTKYKGYTRRIIIKDDKSNTIINNNNSNDKNIITNNNNNDSTKNNSNTNIQNDNQNSISDDTENEISNSDKSSNTIIEDEESENKDEIINNQEQTKEDTKQ